MNCYCASLSLKCAAKIAILALFCLSQGVISCGCEGAFALYSPEPAAGGEEGDGTSIKKALAKAEELFEKKKFVEAVWEYDAFGFLKGEEIEQGFAAEELHHYLLALLAVSDLKNPDNSLRRKGMNRLFRPLQEFKFISKRIKKREHDIYNRGRMIAAVVSVIRATEQLWKMEGKSPSGIATTHKEAAIKRPLAGDNTQWFPSVDLLGYADFTVRDRGYRKEFLETLAGMLSTPVKKGQKAPPLGLAHLIFLNQTIPVKITPSELITVLQGKFQEEKSQEATARVALILGELHRCQAMEYYLKARQLNKEGDKKAEDVLNIRYWFDVHKKKDKLVIDIGGNQKLDKETAKEAAGELLKRLSENGQN